MQHHDAMNHTIAIAANHEKPTKHGNQHCHWHSVTPACDTNTARFQWSTNISKVDTGSMRSHSRPNCSLNPTDLQSELPLAASRRYLALRGPGTSVGSYRPRSRAGPSMTQLTVWMGGAVAACGRTSQLAKPSHRRCTHSHHRTSWEPLPLSRLSVAPAFPKNRRRMASPGARVSSIRKRCYFLSQVFVTSTSGTSAWTFCFCMTSVLRKRKRFEG